MTRREPPACNYLSLSFMCHFSITEGVTVMHIVHSHEISLGKQTEIWLMMGSKMHRTSYANPISLSTASVHLRSVFDSMAQPSSTALFCSQNRIPLRRYTWDQWWYRSDFALWLYLITSPCAIEGTSISFWVKYCCFLLLLMTNILLSCKNGSYDTARLCPPPIWNFSFCCPYFL